MKTALLVALCALLGSIAHSLFFYITESRQRCFLQDIPEQTLVVGNYKIPTLKTFDAPDFDGIGVVISATDPASQPVITKTAMPSGRFAFTSQVGGQHMLCFSTNTTRWFKEPKRFRIDLEVQVGEMTIDYTELAKKEHLTDLERTVRQLNERVRDVIKEQEYQREREMSFRDTSESTGDRVVWWTVIQMTLLIVVGAYQAYHLTNFFKTKQIS